MATVLDGLKVLDLTSGPAGGLATMVLGDFGAQVLRAVDPEYAELNQHPSASLWLRGKHLTYTPVQDLAAQVDIVVATRPNGFSEADPDTLRLRHPDLIYADISNAAGEPFLPPEITLLEDLVAARFGESRALQQLIGAATPVYPRVPFASFAAAMNLVTGILAAVHERSASGWGQRVSTSFLDSYKALDLGESLARQLHPAPFPSRKDNQQWMQNGLHVQCGDGRWLLLGPLSESQLPHFLNTIDLQHYSAVSKPLAETALARAHLQAKILAIMQNHASDEWLQRFKRTDCITAFRVNSPAEALDDSDMLANEHVMNLAGVKQVGPIAEMNGTHPQAQTDQADWAPANPPSIPPDTPPLSGVTVVEIAGQSDDVTFTAAALGTSFLADLGARVIRVVATPASAPALNGSVYQQMRCQAGKSLVGISLDHEEGVQLFMKLLGHADILVKADELPADLLNLLEDSQLHARLPHLISLAVSGFGRHGPHAGQRITPAIAAALSGATDDIVGGLPTRLLDQHHLHQLSQHLGEIAGHEPVASLAVALPVAALAALCARQQGRHSQAINVDMLRTCAYTNFDDLLERPPAPETTVARRKTAPSPFLNNSFPLRQLYQSESGWILLGIARQREWALFCEIIDRRRWLDQHANPVNSVNPELQQAMAELFAEHTAEHWQRLLLPRGIGCVAVAYDNPNSFFVEQARQSSTWMTRAEFQIQANEPLSAYRPRAMVNFSRCHTLAPGSSPFTTTGKSAAEHLGYSNQETESLLRRGLLW